MKTRLIVVLGTALSTFVTGVARGQEINSILVESPRPVLSNKLISARQGFAGKLYAESSAASRNFNIWRAGSLYEAKSAIATQGGAAPHNRFDRDSCKSSQLGPGATNEMLFSGLAGVEQVGSSSLPSETEPFVRFFTQSEGADCFRLWGSFRLLGAPNQSDTSGIFSVFADPTGQIITSKLSSVGTAIDFAVGPAYRLHAYKSSPNSVDIILGFGATTPLQSNKVTEAFTTPVYGTAECNILFNKFAKNFGISSYGIQKAANGVATASSSACLLNTNAPTTTNGTTTFAPVNTIAFSNPDRTSFLLKDLLGLRWNHTIEVDSTSNVACTSTTCYLGMLDFTFGQDSAITGGVLRGNRVVFKADGVYPVIVGGFPIYVFGSFSTRIERNSSDNTPLVLQAATLATVAASGVMGVPNVNTVVLPLKQPDRDFYRIGVAIDLMTLIKKKP